MGSEIADFEEKTPESHEEERRGTKRESLEEVGSQSKRPSRERRSVERFCSLSPIRASASKSLSISQGSGTKLKEIPNVAFKLSKRKVDENLQALHTILFGRKSNVHVLKRNIFQFSGFVWTTDEKSKKSAETEVKSPKAEEDSPKAEEDESEDRASGSTDDAKDASSGKEDTNGLEEGSDHVKHEDDEENEYLTLMQRKDGYDEAHLEEAAELEVKNASSGKIPSKSASKQAVQPVEDEMDVAVDSKSGSTSIKETIQKCSKSVTKEKADPGIKEDKNKSSSKTASVDTNVSGTSKSSKSVREDKKKKGQNKEKAVPEDKKDGKKKEAKNVQKVSTKE